MTLRLARTLFACLLGVTLTGTQAMAAASATCQPTAKRSCCSPGQQAAPGCHMGCEDRHAPEAVSTSGTARMLTVPVPDAVTTWHEDAAQLEDANAVTLARCLFHPPTLKRYLLDRTLRL